MDKINNEDDTTYNNGVIVDTLTPFLHKSKTPKSSISPFWKQLIAVTPTTIAFLEAGMSTGHSATLLPQLKLVDDELYPDEYTGSWIASVLCTGMLPASLATGIIVEKFGRKPAMFISGILNPLGWTLIALAQNLTHILIGRFFLGAAYGFMGVVFGTYTGEVTDPKNRGLILVIIYTSMGLGVLLAHAFDIAIYWRWTACICGIISLLQIATVFVIPESPVWLISKNKIKEAASAFAWLRGYDDKAMSELKDAIEIQKLKSNEKLTFRERIDLLKKPQFLKPLTLIFIMFLISQAAGLNYLVFYAVDIIKKTVKGDVNNNSVVLIVDAVRVITSIVSCFANKSFPRRTVFFTSSIGSGISMLGLVVYLYCSKIGIAITPLFPVICFTTFMLFLNLGIVPLAGLSSSELFPVNLREIGNTLASVWCFSIQFLVAKLTPIMFVMFGEIISFGTCLIIIVVGGIVIYLFLPEAKGRTLQEIQDNFKTWNGR